MPAPVLVVSLDRTPQRFEQFRVSNPNLVIERVSAVDGSKLDRDRCIRDGFITAANRYTPAAIGCAASHVGLWRRCAAGFVPLTVAEDDVVLRADFHAMSEAVIARLPDWDIIKWCWNYDWPVLINFGPGVPSAVLQSDQINTDIDIVAFRSGTATPLLARLDSAAGTGCYSISPRGAQRLLAACLPFGVAPASYVASPPKTWNNSGVDVECCRHYSGMNAFLSLPPLAMASNAQDMSTIRGHLAVVHDPSKANRAVV